MAKEKNFLEAMGTETKGYKQFKIGKKTYMFRIPSALEEIELEDANISGEGEINIYGYINDLLRFVAPALEMKDLVKRNNDTIAIGENLYSFKKVTAKEYFDIIAKTQRVVVENGERKTRINQLATLKSIAKCADEPIDLTVLTRDELGQLMEKFGEIFDATEALNIYETFQSTK